MKYVRIIDGKGNAVAEIRIPDEYDIIISTTSIGSVHNIETIREAEEKASAPPQAVLQTQPVQVQEDEKQRRESISMDVDREHEAVESVKEMRREIESGIENVIESLLPGSPDKQAETTPMSIDEYMQKEMANVEAMAKMMEKKMKSPDEQKKVEAIESIIDEILEFNPEVK